MMTGTINGDTAGLSSATSFRGVGREIRSDLRPQSGHRVMDAAINQES
jgi:hypothetical protein